ncbi:MAG: glycerol-3-phosphate 1-O-acyltransferase PlsY [Anaerolineae bacterium]|nr:glycerol-3-phosphate 1-O-acyltransferase PlsY [Anaerolineae bacterium]
MWRWIGVILIGYVLGSIPFGVLIARWVRGIDVRAIGSGRTGGTNVLRAAGWQAGLLTAIVDTLKAAAAVWVARWIGATGLVLVLVGMAAVVGHNYSLFLGFRGGAGTMASIGAAMALWPWNVLILALTGLGVVLTTRRASLGSIVVACLLPILFIVRALLGASPWEYVVYGVLASALTLWALRANIKRLLRGEERQISFSKS